MDHHPSDQDVTGMPLMQVKDNTTRRKLLLNPCPAEPRYALPLQTV